MYKKAAIVIAAAMFMNVSAQQDAPAQKATAAKPAASSTKAQVKGLDTLIVNARLTEIPGKMPPNDLYNYVYIMKYRILNVVKGKYEGQEILVGQYNPLISRAKVKDKMDVLVNGDVEKFEVGAKHQLTLVAPLEKVWKDAVEDDYFDSDLTKYFAVKTDILKEAQK